MHAAPRPASRTGGGPGPSPVWAKPLPACAELLLVMTVLAYGADMGSTLGEQSVSSQKGFGADLLEALTAVAELVNTGRSRDGEGLRDVADVAAFGRRYGLGGRARAGDVPALRAYRVRLDAIVTACEAADITGAVRILNALLAETGAIPQIVSHDGRGPHVHVSRAAAPMADRLAAHLAMGL